VDRYPLGLNTYCLRAFRWPDLKLLEYAASLQLDAVFLQDSLDPGVNDPAHWREVKEAAQRLGLHLETGGSGSLPRDLNDIAPPVAALRNSIKRASAMGSPIVRTLIAGDRYALPKGVPIDKIIETMIKVYRSVRTEAMDAGLKLAIENHKELLCWQTRQVIEGAGKEFVGSYLDTGNPVFVMEDPMETMETLGPLAVTFHLRDSVIYESKNGAMVQWVPLGEGVVDFPKIVAKARTLCPNVSVYIKPITGRRPAEMRYLDPEWMRDWRDVKASSLARFLALAKNGHPYEREMVIEDIVGQTRPEPYQAALQYQQKEHMERSVEYGKKSLDLGIKWRSA
jgi:sugar phosphate isomerase/epimerase